MSDQPQSSQPQIPPTPEFHHETQSERRFKYGINVAVAVIALIAISSVLVYLAQANDRRFDTTSSGEFSLKPQTLNVLNNLKDKVTIVSLYTHAKPPATDDNGNPASQSPANKIDEAQTVADLLDEYKRDGKSIDVEVIDPNTEKDKLAKLHDQLIADYGSQIQSYKNFLGEWDKQYPHFEQLTKDQAAAMTAVTGGQSLDDSDDSAANTSGFRPDLVRTIKSLPRSVAKIRDEINSETAKRYPQWKTITGDLKDFLQQLSDLSGSLATNFAKLKDEKEVPQNVKEYVTKSGPRFSELKTAADDLIAKSNKLGELKLDQIEDALKVENPILVLGPDDYRVIQQAQVWPTQTGLRDSNGVLIPPHFAGEQQVTAAIYALTTHNKPKICFMRPSGPPLTSDGFPPFVQAGPLSEIADRMRLYNFDITEKDLSGTWAAQAQMQQQPSEPEPSDDQIKDAIWVVLDMAKEFGGGQDQMPPTPITPKLKEHLDQGGSAMIVFGSGDEDLAGALDSWGVKLHPDAMIVHQPVHLEAGSAADLVEEFKSRPADFVVSDYGDHEITKPVNSLDSIWIPTMAVSTQSAPGATATPLVQMDKNFPGSKVWGSTSLDAIQQGQDPVFDPSKDLSPPVYGMAVSEKKSGNRLVVLGSPIMLNGRINIPDPQIAEKEGRYVSRFPGNGELTANSLFWLAHLDPMIAISPAAMDVSRIGPINHNLLNFWRYGVLLILLPLSMTVWGLLVYTNRRD